MTKLVIAPSIQVGGHTFAIVFNAGLKDENDYARINHRLLKIELNPARPQSQKVEALIHEILHAINDVYANGKLMEDDIDAISQGLLQVFSQCDIQPDFNGIPEEGDGE